MDREGYHHDLVLEVPWPCDPETDAGEKISWGFPSPFGRVSVVSVRDNHAAAVTATGDLYTWGCDPTGQLGSTPGPSFSHGAKTPCRVQVFRDSSERGAAVRDDPLGTDANPVPGQWRGQRIVDVACSSYATAVVTVDGALFTCGRLEGPLEPPGLGEHHPEPRDQCLVEVAALRGARVAGVSAGQDHMLAHSESGRLWRWGRVPGAARQTIAEPQLVKSLGARRVAQTACGMDHFCCVTADGRLFTWGRGSEGQLGHGDLLDRPEPAEVAGLGGRVADVACGNEHTVAVLAGGGVKSFGCGVFGRLGQGDEARKAAPGPVAVAGP